MDPHLVGMFFVSFQKLAGLDSAHAKLGSGDSWKLRIHPGVEDGLAVWINGEVFFFFCEKAPFFLLDQVGNVFKHMEKKGGYTS